MHKYKFSKAEQSFLMIFHVKEMHSRFFSGTHKIACCFNYFLLQKQIFIFRQIFEFIFEW